MPEQIRPYKVFSAQNLTVASKLEAGLVHRPNWCMSAAFIPTPGDPNACLHRTAYLWMVEQYERAMTRSMVNAPAWVVFFEDRATIKDKNCEVVIELEVPSTEIFITQYVHSPMSNWECVLHFEPCHDESCSANPTGCPHVVTPQLIRQSWDALLVLSDNERDWQGVLDRFEPSWYRRTC
jgi:hypothetical protein